MIAIIRIRGLKHIRHDVKHAFMDFRLDRKNHCVLVKEGPVTNGMLTKIKDYAAYGPVKAETIAKLIEKRGRVEGDKKVGVELLKAHKLSSFADLGKHLVEGKTTLQVMGIKPVFRLNSPKKGFARVGIKQPVSKQGDLGFHKDGVDALIGKMM